MKREEIIESFAQSYQADRYPPISGKVIAILTLSKERYISFEEIQKELRISKSALSKNLNLLIETHQVCFINAPNSKRKRLFGLDIEGITEHLESISENFKFQQYLTIEAKKHRIGGDKEVCEFLENSINFSDEVIKELEIITQKYFKK